MDHLAAGGPGAALAAETAVDTATEYLLNDVETCGLKECVLRADDAGGPVTIRLYSDHIQIVPHKSSNCETNTEVVGVHIERR